MALDVVGTPQDVSSGLDAQDPAAKNVTVEAGSNTVVFQWHMWPTNDGDGIEAVTLDGLTPDETISELPRSGSDESAVGTAVWYGISSGTKSLDVAWDSGPLEGPGCVLACLQDVDTSTGIVDVGNDQGASTAAVNVDLTVGAGDLCLKFDARPNMGDDPPNTSGWTSEALVLANVVNGRLASIFSAGGTQSCPGEDENWTTVAAVAFTEASTETGVPGGGGDAFGAWAELPWATLPSSAPAGAISGSSTPTFTNTATLLGKGALAGTSSPTFTNTAVIRGRVAIAATSTPTFTNTAILLGKGALAGTSNPVFTNSGLLTNDALVGTSTLSFTNTATLLADGALAGSSTPAFTNTATLVADGALAGTSTPTFTNTALIRARGALAGTSTPTFTNTGALAAGAIAGTAALSFANTATLLADGALAGTSAPSFTNTATLRGLGAALGTSTPSFSNTATIRARGALAGASNPTFSLTGVLASGAMEGVAAQAFTTTGVLTSPTSAIIDPGVTKAQKRLFRKNDEYVLTSRGLTAGTSFEVRISGTAEGTVRNVGGLRAVAGVFGASAAATIRLYTKGHGWARAGTLTLPVHTAARIRGGAFAQTAVGQVVPQTTASVTPLVRRRAVAQAGTVQAMGVSNPSDRELAMLALDLVRKRRAARQKLYTGKQFRGRVNL